MPYSEADKRTLLAEARRRVANADGGSTSTLATQRQEAEKYYRGERFGDEVAGRSQVVSRDVAQYIDSQMPSLMRIFASGDEVVVFEPTQQQDEEGAKQATDYVNWLWRQNDGFLRFHTWFKDGLLAKLGTVKIWWDDSPTTTRESYHMLTDAELEAMRADGDIEVGEVTTEYVPSVGPDGMPALVAAHNVEVIKTERMGRVRVANVPPEEFVFGKRTVDDRVSDVFAHVTKKRKPELIADGFDPEVVNGLATYGEAGDADGSKIVRFRDVDDGNTTDHEDDVEIVEAYFRHAIEDDEPARLYQVTYSGDVVLECEEVDDHPFACVTPILMPHRLVGMSTADQTMDIQRVKSTIWRQMLDNLYLTNAPQMGAVEGQVNLDDLLTRRPGGVIRMKSPTGLVPIPTTPLGQEPYQMIEYLDTQGEQRTGVTRYNQGLDADTLNKTASGINMIQNAAQQRLELIARVYAETGVKRAFKRILGLVQKHQTKPQMIRLRNTWVAMDPRTWSNSMDMTVTVGLGNGNKDQTLAHIMSLLQLDQTIVAMQGGVQGPLVTAPNIYAKLKKLIEAAGLRSVEMYYTDPESPEMQQAMQQRGEQPDPKTVEIQGKLQIEQMQAQARLATDKAAAEQEFALSQQKAAMETSLAMKKAEVQAQIDIQKAQLDAELARQKAALDVAEMQAKAAADQRAQQFDMIHGAIKSHAELMMQDQHERSRMDSERRQAEERRAAEAAEKAAEPEEDDEMEKEPSPEYKAMVSMMAEMQGVVKSLAQTTAALEKTQADMVPLIKRAGAKKRAIRDADGKIIGSEPVE